jgi:hypothetical protein
MNCVRRSSHIELYTDASFTTIQITYGCYQTAKESLEGKRMRTLIALSLYHVFLKDILEK